MVLELVLAFGREGDRIAVRIGMGERSTVVLVPGSRSGEYRPHNGSPTDMACLMSGTYIPGINVFDVEARAHIASSFKPQDAGKKAPRPKAAICKMCRPGIDIIESMRRRVVGTIACRNSLSFSQDVRA